MVFLNDEISSEILQQKNEHKKGIVTGIRTKYIVGYTVKMPRKVMPLIKNIFLQAGIYCPRAFARAFTQLPSKVAAITAKSMPSTSLSPSLSVGHAV
jgi:hypothetical protein